MCVIVLYSNPAIILKLSYAVFSMSNQYDRPWSTQAATQREQAQFKRRQEEVQYMQ